jgi:hypothetical protein
MNIILTLLGIIGALIGAFFFQRSKAQSASALNENIKVKEDLVKADAQISNNKLKLTEEDVKRLQLLEDVKKEKDETPTPDDLVDFFNKRK